MMSRLNPKPQGRRPGKGLFTYRQVPPEEAIHETIVVPLEACPDCGRAVHRSGQRALRPAAPQATAAPPHLPPGRGSGGDQQPRRTGPPPGGHRPQDGRLQQDPAGRPHPCGLGERPVNLEAAGARGASEGYDVFKPLRGLLGARLCHFQPLEFDPGRNSYDRAL